MTDSPCQLAHRVSIPHEMVARIGTLDFGKFSRSDAEKRSAFGLPPGWNTFCIIVEATIHRVDITTSVRQEEKTMHDALELFSYERHGDTLVVMPVVNLSEFEFAHIEQEVRSLLEFLDTSRIANVVVDFQRTSYFGSTAISALLKLSEKVHEKHGAMVLCNLSKGEHEILDVANLESLWRIAASRQEAMDSLQPMAAK
jgi:anti-anti-sigma factor